MTQKIPVYSFSISMRFMLDMQSLNNERSEGNQLQTRMVDIMIPDRRLFNVNAISGDMFKHIQTEHLFHIARDREELPLCQACHVFDANRISADSDFINQVSGKNDSETTDMMLERCTIDDLEGVLITVGRSTPRKSVVEFGWAVGIPVDEQGNSLITSNSYFHVKFVPERSSEPKRAIKKGEAPRKSSLGQMPSYKPASSGLYALVSHYEVSRIGYNDITQHYAIDEKQRQFRYQALLESVLFTFLQMNGALRSTQLPHLVAMEGAITYTSAVIPAPTFSPVNPNYCQEIADICNTLDQVYPRKVEMMPFDSLSQFVSQMQWLIGCTVPFAIRVS